MIRNTDIEPKDFSFRLFLDDYVIKSPLSSNQSNLMKDLNTKSTESRKYSHHSKLYYQELDEIDTFCCHDGENFSESTKTRESTTNFCFSNFRMRFDSLGVSDVASIFSNGPVSKEIQMTDIQNDLKDQHFENLRARLIDLLKDPLSTFERTPSH